MNENDQVNNLDANKDANLDTSLAASKPKRELTAANRVFLQLLADGVSTLEAYEQAGYSGEKHAAYQLRYDLKEYLVQLLEARGLDRAGLMSEVVRLNSLPLRDYSSGITFSQKLDLLKLVHKLQPADKADRPRITAFQLNIGQPKQTIETEIVDEH